MLLCREILSSDEFHRNLHHRAQAAAAVSFGNDNNPAARLEDASDLGEVSDKIGPVVMSFDCRGKVEPRIWKRKRRYRSAKYRDSTGVDKGSVLGFSDGYAARRIVDAENPPIRVRCRQLLDGAATTTDDIQNGVVVADSDIFKTPIGYARMSRVHQR